MSSPQPGPGVEGLPPRPGGGGNGGSGASGIEFTDGVNTVNGSTKLTVTGATVGGTSPDATLTVDEQTQQWTAGDVADVGAGLEIVGVGTSTSWNPADKSSTITLSGSDLIATSTGAGAVRTTGNAYSTGKRYFELNVTAATTDISIGIANATETLTDAEQLGSTVNSVGAYPFLGEGELFINNVSLIGAGGSTSATGVNAFAIDFDAGSFWWSAPSFRTAGNTWNKSATANPATGIGGIPLATLGAGPYMIAMGESATGGAVTLATLVFSLSVPSGFDAWDGDVVQTLQAEWTAGAVTDVDFGGAIVGTALTFNYALAKTDTLGGNLAIVGTTLTDGATGNTFQSSNVPVGDAIALSTGAAVDVTSLSLEAGNWLVFGNLVIDTSVANATNFGWISETSETFPTLPGAGSVVANGNPFTGNQVFPVGVQYFSFSSPATVYLSAECIFGSGSAGCYGFLGAIPLK